jgi:hypothetical protein
LNRDQTSALAAGSARDAANPPIAPSVRPRTITGWPVPQPERRGEVLGRLVVEGDDQLGIDGLHDQLEPARAP